MELASIINTVTIWFLFQIGSFELTYSDGDLGGKETKQKKGVSSCLWGAQEHSWMNERWKELTSTLGGASLGFWGARPLGRN
jgi:putative NADPH-quinone reductase